MGKRSQFERRERDYYSTPPAAVLPLIAHLPPSASYAEPCVGGGHLVEALTIHGKDLRCVWQSDILPQTEPSDLLFEMNAMDLSPDCVEDADYIITNPPWPIRDGSPTVEIAAHLASLKPTWLLLAADFCHNRYFGKIAGMCSKIVSVGRVQWIEGSKHTGKDNAAWMLFDARHIGTTAFFGRPSASETPRKRVQQRRVGVAGGVTTGQADSALLRQKNGGCS